MNEIRMVPVFGPLALYADGIRSEPSLVGRLEWRT
jgi:hypothetical protein